MKKEIFITNRKGLKLAINLSTDKTFDKLVFLMHGLGARKDYPHMQVMENIFFKHGFNVVNIDATNSNNNSDKSEESITFTGHYNDLEDVISWAKTQSFYKEHFALAGQSMGAVACALYAGQNKNVNVLILANFSWIDGKVESKNNRRREEIEEKGYYVQTSKSTGKSFVIKQNYLDDLEKYNLTEYVKNITADTSVIIGMRDTEYHIKNGEKLYDLLKCPKQIFKLDGVPHDLANTSEDKEKFSIALEEILK